MAMSLATFDVSLATDDKGVPIIPEIEPMPGIVRSVISLVCLVAVFILTLPSSQLRPYNVTLASRFSTEQLDELIRQ